jgi:hypothetical protein
MQDGTYQCDSMASFRPTYGGFSFFISQGGSSRSAP